MKKTDPLTNRNTITCIRKETFRENLPNERNTVKGSINCESEIRTGKVRNFTSKSDVTDESGNEYVTVTYHRGGHP